MIVIVGGGPSGLTTALIMSKLVGDKVILIERNKEIGGCHRVVRAEDHRLTEHGPRIYSDSFHNFKRFIQDELGLTFNSIFSPIDSSGGFVSQLRDTMRILSIKEVSTFGIALMCKLANPLYGLELSVKQFMIDNGFTDSSMRLIDTVCRYTDGAGSDRYSMFKFIDLVYQQGLNTIYEPTTPNDVILFERWRDRLVNSGVIIYTEMEVTSINSETKQLFARKNKQQHTFMYNQIILAIPPMYIADILKKSPTCKDIFGDFREFEKWAQETNYITYISMTFHYDHHVSIEPLRSNKMSTWGVVGMILHDEEDRPVISCAITQLDTPSEFTGLSANQTDNSQELMSEAFRQLGVLRVPTKSILFEGVYYKNDKWHMKDSAYVRAVGTKPIDFKTHDMNIFTVGCHTGYSLYHFTSIEAAVTNAIIFTGIISGKPERIFYPYITNVFA